MSREEKAVQVFYAAMQRTSRDGMEDWLSLSPVHRQRMTACMGEALRSLGKPWNNLT